MRFPKTGDRVTVADYGNTPYLFHWTTLEGFEGLCRHRYLTCGTGQNWPDIAHHLFCVGRLYWSTQMERWGMVIDNAGVLLRAPVRHVDAIYDGSEWIYTGDEDEAWSAEWGSIDRLADAFSTKPTPIHLLEGILVEDPREWTEKIDEAIQHLSIPPSSDAMGTWLPLEELCDNMGIS